MEAPDELTPPSLLALCREYMVYARSAQNFECDKHDLQYQMRQKFLKNTLIFTMILSDLLLVVAADNATNEEIVEISEVAGTLRKTLLDLCEVHRPRILSFVFSVENFILRLQSISSFPIAGPKASIKLKQLAQCVSVLETADYSELEVLAEKQEPSDERREEDEYIIYETLGQIFRNGRYGSVGGFSYGGSKTVSFDAHMGRPSYQKEKEELLWICQDYPVIFRQAYDDPGCDDSVTTIHKCCCVALACWCFGKCVP